jgi:hypothetical protein
MGTPLREAPGVIIAAVHSSVPPRAALEAVRIRIKRIKKIVVVFGCFIIPPFLRELSCDLFFEENNHI